MLQKIIYLAAYSGRTHIHMVKCITESLEWKVIQWCTTHCGLQTTACGFDGTFFMYYINQFISYFLLSHFFTFLLKWQPLLSSLSYLYGCSWQLDVHVLKALDFVWTASVNLLNSSLIFAYFPKVWLWLLWTENFDKNMGYDYVGYDWKD